MIHITMLACSKTKLKWQASASKLYQGSLFKLAKRYYNEALHYPYYILSAKHGLVIPNQLLYPYDLSLYDMTRPERRAWYEMVNRQMEDQEMFSAQYQWHIACAPMYYQGFNNLLRGRIEYPLKSLGYGQQLAKLTRLFNDGYPLSDPETNARYAA